MPALLLLLAMGVILGVLVYGIAGSRSSTSSAAPPSSSGRATSRPDPQEEQRLADSMDAWSDRFEDMRDDD